MLSPKPARLWRYGVVVALLRRRRARTTTLSGVVSEAVTPQMALITASATCWRTAALRQAFGSQVILCESVSREHGLMGAAGVLDERHGFGCWFW